MANEARETVICVDMGMTGSVAKWRDNQWNREWPFTSEHKIPTKVAYDPWDRDGPPIAWGTQCERLPSAQIKECFQIFIGATNFSNTINSEPGRPGSQLELHRWVRDYLSAFCADVVAFIDNSVDNTSWRDGTVIWNFTVPGSWAAFPVVADFKRPAGEAVSSCFQNSKCLKICTDITEARASAQCLLREGSVVKDKQYAIGNAVISCDIGGATTDVAVSTVSGGGVLSSWSQVQINPAGTVTIERAFWLHASQTLRCAGVQHPDPLALEMFRDMPFQLARAGFMKDQSGDPVRIRLPVSCNIRNWSPPETANTSMSTIELGNLCIHRDVFESFFAPFVQQIEVAMDEARNTAIEAKRRPTIIGFCGGGCKTLYAMNRFQQRYEGHSISIIDHTQLAIRPEMATVIGSTMIWDQMKIGELVAQTSFGIEENDRMKWMTPTASKIPSKFSHAYPWLVHFNCNKHSSRNTHKIISVPTAPVLPNAYSEALRLLNSKSWTVHVDLEKEKGGPLSWNRKYILFCNIAGPKDIEFRAKSLVTRQDIPCTVIG